MTTQTKSERPPSRVTLESARENGTLPPLDRTRVRAQLGMLDAYSATDVRRATRLMLSRLLDYYGVIQYTGPSYVYGRVESTYPAALYAVASHNYMYDTWSYRDMGPSHPTCSIESVFEEAGWVCIDTACKLAAHEMALEVPEAKEALRQARYAVGSLLAERAVSGINWADSRRRLGTPGIRKTLIRLLATLPTVQIGLGPVAPVILSKDKLSQASACRHVREWSLPEQAA